MLKLKITTTITSIIVVYLYWVSFEWTILSPIHNYIVIQYIRNFIDVLPLIILGIILLSGKIKFKGHDAKIFSGFLLIILISSISLFIEIQNILPITSYIGVTFRFVPFILIIKYASEDVESKFFKHVKIIYWIQVVLSCLSLINKSIFLRYFLPPREIFGTIPPTTYNDLGISTTFVNTIEYSFFILALTIIYLSFSENKKEKIFITLISLILVTLSFSIASLLAMLFIIFLNTDRKLLFISIGAIALLIVIWFNIDLFLILLGTDSLRTWIEISSEYNRIGYFTKLLPEFLHSNFKDIFLGMGYEGGIIDSKFASYHTLPATMTNYDNNLRYLKDVYWLSILIAQGIVALLITFEILRTIYMTAKKKQFSKNFNVIRLYIPTIILLGFFNQILDIKGLTYCFWILAAITLNKTNVNYSMSNKEILIEDNDNFNPLKP